MISNVFKRAAMAAVGLGWVAVASAQPPMGEGPRRGTGPGGPGMGLAGRGPGAPIERIAEALDLTNEQKEQWKAIHEREREAARPLVEAVDAARGAFDQSLNAENADPATVGKAALSMRAATRKLEAHHKAVRDEVRAILTPEQVAKLEALEQRDRRGALAPDGPGQSRGSGGGAMKRRPAGGSK